MAKYIINTDMIPVEIPNKSEVVTFFGEPVKELIRCRECLFWPNGPLTDNDFLFRDNIKAQCMPMGPNDFCSKAERRKK